MYLCIMITGMYTLHTCMHTYICASSHQCAVACRCHASTLERKEFQFDYAVPDLIAKNIELNTNIHTAIPAITLTHKLNSDQCCITLGLSPMPEP